MKKQLRLVLFAVLVMLLVMTMALVASAAATDGATTAEEGHYYSVVSSEGNATPKYYTTLAAAVTSIDADGYKITVLADTSDEAWVLNSNYTYTITGGTEGKTVTFTSHDASKKALVYISAGNVTIENLTLVRAETITVATSAAVYVDVAGTVTLHNMVTSAAVKDTLYVNKVATVTVSGANTNLSGATENIADLRQNATLNITGGTLTGGVGGPVFFVNMNKAPTVSITNATVASGAGKAVFGTTMVKAKVTLGTGASVTANGYQMLAGFVAGSTLTVDGASLILSGEGALLHPNSNVNVTITSTAGTVYVKDGAALPAEGLDKTDTKNGFDWSKLSVQLAALPGAVEITTGEYTLTSAEQALQLAKQLFLAAYTERFPNIDVAVAGSASFKLNGEDAKLTITEGEYVLDSVFVEVVAGTLTVSGGTITGAANKTVFLINGGNAYFAGGTVTGGAGGSVASLTGGTLHYASGAYVAGAEGVVFDVQGGTLDIDGADEKLDQHRYMLLASGENASPSYYTTLANAMAAIDADGYTITVLADETALAWVLDLDYTYTIVGATDDITITFNGKDVATESFVNVCAGNVTISNLSFVRDAQYYEAVTAFVYISDEASVTLNGVKTDLTVFNSIYVAAAATVTVSGDTAMGDFSSTFASVNAENVSLSVAGGTITSRAGSKVFAVGGAQNVVISLSGAEFVDVATLLYADNAAVTMQIGNATVRANNGTLFVSEGQSSTVVLNGATLYVTGADARLRAAETSTVVVTPTAATFDLAADAPLLVTYLGNIANENWTPIVFLLRNINSEAVLKTPGNYTFTSINEVSALILAQAQNNFVAEYGERFPLAQAIYPEQLDFSSGLVVDHAEITVTLNGNFLVESNVVITLRAGTLNIASGTYSMVNGSRLVDMQGGTMNVTGGTYVVAGSAHLVKLQAGTLNITDGAFSGTDGADSSLILSVDTIGDEPATINISGGDYKICSAIQLSSKVVANVSGGRFAGLTSKTYSHLLHIEHPEAKLFVTGGEFVGLRRGVMAFDGEVTITGGHFSTSKNISGQCIYISGPVKMNISGDAVFEIVLGDKNRRCIYVATGSEQAEINISGGTFGDLAQNFAITRCIWVNNTVGSINITGGVFYGGMTKEAAITISSGAADSKINISGNAQFYANNPLLVQAKATVNISGGSFNPHVANPDSYMIKIDSAAINTTCNISGGTFNNYMVAIQVKAYCTLGFSGGTFTERAVTDTDDSDIVNAVASIPKGLGIPLNVSGGTFVPVPGHKVFDITTGSVSNISITGGTFHVSGEKAELLPRELFDVEGTTAVLSGATLHLGGGAILPIYDHLIADNLHIVASGKYYVPGRVTVRLPYEGEDPDGNGYVIRTAQDMGALLAGQFASWEGEGTCASTFIPFVIDGDDVIVTLENYSNAAHTDAFITVVRGTLKVKGGTYTAIAGERLFEILGDATVTIEGGTFNVQGVESYMLYIAEGVSTENISVSAASILVGEYGEIPLFAKFNISADNLTVYGMSDVVLNEAKIYTITGFASLTGYLREALERKFTANLTVDIQTWVPLRVDNAGAKLVITDGDYLCKKDFMFSITAGEIVITGGRFENIAGDIIRVLGENVKITINLPDDDQSGMYTAGSIVSATNANGLNVTVTGGRFVELAPDTTNDAKRALFAFVSSLETPVSATLAIENGYFEASRMVLADNVAATVTIDNGTFLSNMVVGTTRATNAHMFALIDADARLTINGGSFDNKAGNYIIAQLTEAGSATTINGGTFNGGSGWFYTNVATSLVINAIAEATKNPVFTDTDEYGIESCGYFYLDNAGATLSVHAGSFTSGESYEPIFRIKKGTLTVNGGTFEGYLFYVTEDSRITVNGGSYTASGAGAAIVHLIGNITRTQLNITVPLNIGVQDNASFFETTLSKDDVLALLSGVTYAVEGSARLSLPVAITENETWNTPADAQHFIADFFAGTGVTVTFGTAGVYSLNLVGNYTIVINGGVWNFLGGTLLTLSGGTDLVVVDGEFLVERGNVFHALEAGSNIVIGDATDPQTAPQFTVDGGGIFRSEKGASTAVIYNGSFIHGIYVNGSLQPTISVAEPLFYFGQVEDDTVKSALTIHNGYFEATSVLTDKGSLITTTIYDGTFKSNYIAQNMTSEHYMPDGETPLAANQNAYTLFYFGNGAETLTIYNGTFDAGLLHAILGLYTDNATTTWTIAGGSFTDGYYWIYSDAAITLNINNRYDGNTLIAEPTFTATDFYTYRGIILPASSTINIGGGKFAMRDKAERHIIVLAANTTLNVTGGQFRVTPGNSYDDGQQLQNDTAVILVSGAGVKLTISGGDFQAARIVSDSVGATTNISGGNFASNAISDNDSVMFVFGNNACAVTITGGGFTGNNYTKAIILIEDGTDTNMTINILGGTFYKSLRWISVTTACTLNIGQAGTKGPSFLGLSDGKSSGVTPYGVHITTAAKAGAVNFYSGTFKLEVSQPYIMFHAVNAQTKFYDDVVAEGPYRLFSITTVNANLHIYGGTYTTIDIGQMFYFSATSATPYTVVIEGGEFNALDSSELFYMASASGITLKVTGGEFFSASSRLIFLKAMSMDFIIEGGEFSTTAMYMIHIDSNFNPLVINGGTFTMLDKEGNNGDDALLYVAGKAYAVVNIKGGNFVDKRMNGKQMFFKYNPQAVINLEGSFNMYSLELKDYFFYDYDDFTNSLLMTAYTPTEFFDNEYYYTCFGYYTEAAPVITKSPALRAVLGGEGITFTASVSVAAARQLATGGTVTYGTLIFPTEYMGEEGWKNGTDFLVKLQAYADENMMPYSSVYTIVDAVNGLITEEDGSLTIRASIINIKEKNHSRSLTGIAFAKVVDEDGKETYYYASHVSSGVSANMREVVKTAMSDLQSKPIEKSGGRVYCYASILYNNKFSRYTTVFQDSMRKYLPEAERKPKF